MVQISFYSSSQILLSRSRAENQFTTISAGIERLKASSTSHHEYRDQFLRARTTMKRKSTQSASRGPKIQEHTTKKRKSTKSAPRGSEIQTDFPMALSVDMTSPSSATSVLMASSALNPEGFTLKTLGDHVILLPPELRFMIYDWLVTDRTIDIIQKWFQKPKKALLANDFIGKLCKVEKFWQKDVSAWLIGRKELASSKEMGFFDPRNTVFELNFGKLPCKETFYKSKRNDKRQWEECLALDRFAHSEIITSVQYLTVNLERAEIFSQDENVSVFQMDLRWLGNFRNLQRIDFYLNETFISREINVRAYEEDDEEVPDLLPYFETVCRASLQSFWRFCGWHHPSRACSCCQRPEVRFHYRQPGSDEWKPVILPFKRTEMVLNRKEADLERLLAGPGHSHRQWLKHSVGWHYLCRH